jgi:hypothetical protein
MFDDKEAWVQFTESETFLTLLQFFWADAEELLNLFNKQFFMVERLLELMPLQQKASLGVYEVMVNQTYDESEWQALDILMSSILVNMISPGY